MLEDMDCGKDIHHIFTEPPEVAVLTDEDLADEDNGGLIDNLSGRQLRARAQVVFADSSIAEPTANDSDSSDDDEQRDDVGEQVDVGLTEEHASTLLAPRKCKRVSNTRHVYATHSKEQYSQQQNVKT